MRSRWGRCCTRSRKADLTTSPSRSHCACSASSTARNDKAFFRPAGRHAARNPIEHGGSTGFSTLSQKPVLSPRWLEHNTAGTPPAKASSHLSSQQHFLDHCGPTERFEVRWMRVPGAQFFSTDLVVKSFSTQLNNLKENSSIPSAGAKSCLRALEHFQIHPRDSSISAAGWKSILVFPWVLCQRVKRQEVKAR